MAATSYLRFPHIAGDLITFVAEDDVWLAPAAGGLGTRLTSDRVPVTRPRLSPDAQRVAWSSARTGETEAHCLALSGGVIEQLTYWGGTLVADWISPSTLIVVGPSSAHSTPRRPWAHEVSLSGAAHRVLPYGPVGSVSVAGDGAVLLSSRSTDPAEWKRYRGGAGGKIWLDVSGSGAFTHILSSVGTHLVDPMFVGDRIAFLSDHEGVGALYSTTRSGDDLRRHTDHGSYYARHASTDGTRVVYECAGEIWLLSSLSSLSEEPVRLAVELPGARVGREAFTVSAEKWLGAYHLSGTGRVAAAEVRGTIHWLPASEGPARTLLATPGVRARMPLVVPGKNAVLCVTDEGGEDGLSLVPADGSPAVRIGQGALGHVYDLAVAPSGELAAVSSEDGRLLLVDLGAASEPGGDRLTELTRCSKYEPRELVFSPDSQYLAWSQLWAAGRGEPESNIKLARLSDRTIVDVTEERFDSVSPVFTHDGKYVAFLSDRTYDVVHDVKLLDLGFLPGTRPYLVTLSEATASPFAPELDGRPAEADSASASDADAGAHSDAASPLHVDLDGIADRIIPLPVEAGDYSQLSAVKGGLAWLSRTKRGELDEVWNGAADDPPQPTLIRFDLGARKRSVLVDELDSYTVSADGGRIAYRSSTGVLQVRAVDAAGSQDAISVDLDRIQVRIDPVAEWTQMYQESWRLTRDNFWRKDMAGIDWAAMADRYRPLLHRLGAHSDFVDLLWELQGELGYSHAYVIPDRLMNRKPTGQGFLGATLAADADGTWRVARILPGESSVVDGRSPLAAPGLRISPGDAILAVDGRPVDRVHGPYPLLAGKAGKPVELTLRRQGTDRRVVVVPLASERTLRYHDMIAARRARVRELSDGRLGYVHVPDMVSNGWAEFHRGHGAEFNREGLIFDLRENGGGHTSQLVIEKLSRKIIGWTRRPCTVPYSYPQDAPRGAVVTLINEMAGSDGDIAANAVRRYGIGPLVGTRTWGGVVGTDRDRALVDRTLVTQPKGANWFDGPGWSIENYGVDPDVEVEISPQDWAAGRDPQLETAVRMALEELARNPAATPPEIPAL